MTLSIIAIIVSAIAAGFSAWQAFTASSTAKRQLRPYLFISSTSEAPPVTHLVGLSVGRPAVAQVAFENTGQTSAYAVHQRIAVKVLDYPLSNNFDLQGGTSISQGMVGPHARMFNSSASETLLTKEEDEEVRKGTKAVYVYGRIDYEDSARVPHWTIYCLYFSSQYNFVPNFCAAHNDGDRD
jgi:hypothetical protein